jgi:uncharacterized protein YebE (UPF0316 family)
MSDRRRRIQFEGSLPWNPLLLLEAMEELFQPKSEQEHIDVMMENNLTYSTLWIEFRKENNLKEQGYYHYPWRLFGKTEKQWFAEIFSKKTEEEHIKIMVDNNLTSSPKWVKFKKENNFREQGYLTAPWIIFGKTQKQWFAEIFDRKSEEEHIEIMVDNNLTSSPKWLKHYEDNNFREHGYWRNPWSSFGKTAKQWFAEIFGAKKTYTEKQYQKIMKDNNLTGKTSWFKYYEENNFKEHGYLTAPWKYFNIKQKQWFAEIFGEKIYRTEQEHIDIVKDNNVIGSPTWVRYYKDNNLKAQGYLCYPWSSFGKTVKQWFAEIYDRKTYTEKQYKKLQKDNNLTGETLWYKYYKDNNLKEQGYKQQCWKLFGIKQKEWFAEVYDKKTYTKKQYIKIMVNNNLIGATSWNKYYNDNNLKEQNYLKKPWKSFKMTQKDWFVGIKKQVKQ